MNHRIKTTAIAATASALTVAGLAVANGGGDRHTGWWPFAHSGGKALTYSETHLRKHGEDVTIRVDQGRVLAVSAGAISVRRNDGETVEVPVDDDTRFIGGGWRKHDVSASHNGSDGADDGDDAAIPAGKRVAILRSDDDPAAEAVTALRCHHHGDDDRGRDRDDD
jgi:hypothetical protein